MYKDISVEHNIFDVENKKVAVDDRLRCKRQNIDVKLNFAVYD